MSDDARPVSDHCRQLFRQISEHLEGDLSPAKARSLEAHLDSCVCCTEFAESLKRAVAACRAAGLCELPPDVRDRAKRRIQELLASPPG